MDRTKRTAISCDRCQRRKVKCQDPVPGPCRACTKAGQQCKVSRETRARPFYQVSQEQFELIVELLRHHEPGLKLDVDSLRARKEARKRQAPEASSCSSCCERILTPPRDAQEESPERIDVSQEMETLDGECISVLVDTSGSYKYVGPRGEAGFNIAVATCLAAEQPEGHKFLLNHVTSSKTEEMDPQSIASFPIAPSPSYLEKHHLPSRSVMHSCAQRFFTHIQCSLWLLPEDQFYARLEQAYAQDRDLKAPWFAFLYAMLSLTAPSRGSDLRGFPRSSGQYYNLSMSFLPLILHQPDLDGVRAVLTLCMALQRHRSLTPSYQLIGVAVRLSQNLGLHLDSTATTRDAFEFQQMRRLWWSVYELERDICMKYGVPSAIVDEYCSTSLPSENLLSPGIGTPIGYLEFSSALDRLVGKVHSVMFVTPAGPNAKKANEKETIDNLLSELDGWRNTLPPYLRFESPSAPAHRRAISLLHLRFWITRVYISRRFLLYHLQHADNIPAEKVSFFETMASRCLDSSEQALAVLKQLAEASLLSDVSSFDSNSILSISLIFLLSYHFRKREADVENFYSCVRLFDILKHVEWPAECVTRLLRIAKHGGLVAEVGQGPEMSDRVADFESPENNGQFGYLSDTLQNHLSPLQANSLMWDALGTWELQDLGADMPWNVNQR